MGFFFDTSALIEYLKRNEEVKQALQEGGVTTKLQLMELYFVTLEEFGPYEAEEAWRAFSPYAKEYNEKRRERMS